jgi:hypothetical protein
MGIRDGAGIFGYFMLGEAGTEAFPRGAPVNTDDRLSLEFSAPRALYVDTTTELAAPCGAAGEPASRI